ncbi:aminomethyltransferase family protein [Puniceibacterium sp. IMCC21224]|uniref:aminomethyltransferase family protein n=1 Tax=Puniceibacterium sp. IMCC21224 TaxID=1618204 RepID=UPI00064DB6E3|nr:aminomethyltransferase family protein [Puniceibacterium sp. IMCC21224]KMK66164.1 glycine cleavage system T protein (aminomethyltransferase) [Puniceibacterium sp. IMCC21224]
MTTTTLADKIAQSGGAARMLQNAQAGAYPFPVAPQFTNWIEEVRAWRQSAVLLDQSYHMTDLYVRGPDAQRLLSHVGVNSFAKFGRNKAKQLICVNPDGYVIGDGILFGLEDDEYLFIGRPPVANWIAYQAETGDFDVTTEFDIRSVENPDAPRKLYRFEVQGPNALDILNAVNEGGPLTTKFFNMGEITIAGCKARTLAHGMGGAQGLELWGPYGDRETVLARLMEVGAAHGLLRAGSRAYSTSAMESGWIPSPLPAIYSGDAMAPYRDWLSATGFEATTSVGGSFEPDNVADYYLTPWDLDYGRVVKFDHDFIGRAALERMAQQTHRTKVTLVWDKDDVLTIFAGMMEDFPAPKLMELPTGNYAAHPYDQVVHDGEMVGISTYPVYSANERAWISLAMVRDDLAATDTALSILWGEKNGGTGKPHVEQHRQIMVGATAQPWPIHAAARQTYRAQT